MWTPAHSERTLEREDEDRGVARVVVTLHPGVPGHAVKAIVDEVLRAAPSSEIEAKHRLESAPVFIARINGRGLKRLLADPRVSRVDLDGEVRGTDEISAAQIGA